MVKISENRIIKELEKIDTPTISNVVATYPKSELCLKLYDPWYGQWYTDATIKCMFPELGPRVGYVATVIFCEKTEKNIGVDKMTLLEHIDNTKKPVILVAEQQFPPELANRVGLFGEMMTTQYKALGVVGVVTNGPIRDVEAIRKLKVQYFATGITASHGEFIIKDVGVPVTVGGMDVKPGDMVHMDINGVVKFPPDKMKEILERAKKLIKKEKEMVKIFKDPNFSLKKLKNSLQK
jgi:regulator of RNase E activity RraA